MQHLLLLHGAIGSAMQLETLAHKWSGRYKVHNLNLPGHGGTQGPEDFSMQHFTGYVKDYCLKQGLDKVAVFGYSMGGYVGLLLAQQEPQLVDKVVTLATKFEWSPDIAAREVKMLQPEVIRQKLPAFAKTLEERHGAGSWEAVLHKTAALLEGLGRENRLNETILAEMQTPVLLMVGDRDKMVSVEETLRTSRFMPNAGLAVLPRTPHPIEQVDPELLCFMVESFIG